jgi:hypothetical protein
MIPTYDASDSEVTMDAEFDTVYNKFIKNCIAVVDGEYA